MIINDPSPTRNGSSGDKEPPMKKISLFLLLLPLFLLLSCGSDDDSSPPKPPVTGNRWTIMIYLDADNDLSSWAMKDVQEMMNVGSTENVTYILQLDLRNVPTRRYKVERDSLTLLEEPGELNMAQGDTLRDFVVSTVRQYPAEHYALIAWNHGQGWKGTPMVKSMFNDYDNGQFLFYTSNDELARSLAEAQEATGVKLDILAIDACSMSVMEAAYEFRDVAGIMVASQELVSAFGWDYEDLFMRLYFFPKMTPAGLARAMVASFQGYYSRSPYHNQTIAAIALDQKYSSDGQTDMTSLAEAVNDLALRLTALMDDPSSRAATLDLLTAARAHVRGFEYIYVDLIDFCFLLEGRTSSVEQTYNKILLAEYHGTAQAGAHGLSIVFFDRSIPAYELVYDPTYRNFDEASQKGSRIAFINEFNWDEMMHRYYALQYPDLPNLTP